MTRDELRSTAAAAGRRRFPRLAVDGSLPAHDLSLDVPMDVQDVSFGGFRTLSPVPLEPGSEHAFEIRLAGIEPLRLFAHVVHCQSGPAARPPFTIGWQLAQDFTTARSITRLIDHLTDAGSFQPAPDRRRSMRHQTPRAARG